MRDYKVNAGRYLLQLKMETFGEQGCTSSPYTAHAVFPAEGVAMHLSAPKCAETYGTHWKSHFMAYSVGSRCMIDAKEVCCIRSCSHDRNREVES